jgi:hypothetical protein
MRTLGTPRRDWTSTLGTPRRDWKSTLGTPRRDWTSKVKSHLKEKGCMQWIGVKWLKRG